MTQMTRIVMIGESSVGEGTEVAHVDLVMGPKSGPVGRAFATAIANEGGGHTNLLAIAMPNLPARPDTILTNKLLIEDERQALQLFEPAQAAIARAVVDSVADGVISRSESAELCVIVRVFIHREAEDDQEIFDYNYAATKEAIRRALCNLHTLDKVLSESSDAQHPSVTRVEA